MSKSMVCLSAVLLLAVSAPASAQEREGFFVSGGGGWGSSGVSFGVPSDEVPGDELFSGDGREGGTAVFVRGGYALTPQLLLGGDLHLWTKAEDLGVENLRARLTIYNVTGTLTYYPQPSAGFFVKGGAGMSFASMGLNAFGSGASFDLGSGLGLTAGLGYDFPIHRRLAITPALTYWYGRLGDVSIMGEPLFSGWRHNVVDITVGLTVR